MAKTLEFYQIYFKDEQLKELYPFAIPYKNEVLTPYFENSVICGIVSRLQQSTDSDDAKLYDHYVGIASWRLRQKRKSGHPEIIFNKKYGDTELTEERIMDQDFDVAKLTPVSHTDMIQKLCQWHPNAGACLDELKKFIRIPEETPHSIYENHFIARGEIYAEYVKTCLAPCIEFIGEKEVFKAPSGYKAKKERFTKAAEVKETLDKLSAYEGKPVLDWDMRPFILERLFSIWITGKGFNVISV